MVRDEISEMDEKMDSRRSVGGEISWSIRHAWTDGVKRAS